MTRNNFSVNNEKEWIPNSKRMQNFLVTSPETQVNASLNLNCCYPLRRGWLHQNPMWFVHALHIINATTQQHASASCIFNINEKIFTFSYTLQIITFLHLEWMRTRFNRYSSSQVTKLIASLLPNLFISWPGKCFLHVSSFLGNFHSAAVSLRSGQFCTRK